ncbi:MAG: 50S ribosomal protein L17 [Candidatus Paceibacterota bacterium]|jgi:large subunit ribosomal protein L17
MRHHNSVRKLSRPRNQRSALLKSLALSLIKSGKIKTTEAKAKELRPFAEKLVTKAKKGDLASRRLVVARLMNREPEVKKLFDVIAPKYKDQKGGYIRIIKVQRRLGDGSKMAYIEFV